MVLRAMNYESYVLLRLVESWLTIRAVVSGTKHYTAISSEVEPSTVQSLERN